MSRPADEEGRKIDDFINPGKKENKTEPEAFVPEDLGPTLLDLHKKSNFYGQRLGRVPHAPYASNMKLNQTAARGNTQVLVIGRIYLKEGKQQ